MATEKLNPSGYDSGWPTGFVSNIDEPVASADGQTISTTIENDVVIIDLDNVSAITDANTVTAVAITVRGRASPSINDTRFRVELLIGSVSQGAAVFTSDLTSFFADQTYTNVLGWNSDWTLAQLNSAQVKITAEKDQAGSETWYIDAIDVDVTYVSPFEPAVKALTLTGQAPSAVPLGDHKAVDPLVGSAALSGQAPGVGAGIGVPVGAVSLRGKVSYVNSLQAQLQVSGWNSGWPTGFVSNIDDTTAVPDGQTISTSVVNDTVILDLDDVTGVLNATDDIVSVTGVFRGDCDDGLGSVSVQLLMEGSGRAASVIALTNTLQNYPLFTDTPVGEGWTIAQLNSMQVRVGAIGGTTSSWRIDAIDITVEYTPQSPITIEPGVGSLTLSGSAPTLFREYIGTPAAGAFTLDGKVPTLFRQDTYYPDERFLTLAGKAPTLRTNYIHLSLVGSLALALKTNSSLTKHLASPAVVALTLAGKVPVPVRTSNHLRTPANGVLQLIERNVLALDDGEAAFAPPQGPLTFTGKVPVLAPTENRFIPTSVGSLTLSGSAPTFNTTRPVSAAAVSLTGNVPFVLSGTAISAGTGAAAMTGQAPELRFSGNPVVVPAPYGLRLFSFQGLQLLSHTPQAAVAMYRAPTVGALVLAGENPAPQTTSAAVISVPSTQLTLAGQAPVAGLIRNVFPAAAALALSGYAPVKAASTTLPVGKGALLLTGKFFNVETLDARVVAEGTLTLTGAAPSLTVTSGLTPGQPGLISLSVDYDIEFIATPTTILLP